MLHSQIETLQNIPAISASGIFRKIVSYLVILSLSLSPLSAYPSPSTTQKNKDYKEAITKVDELMELVIELRNQIDRSQFAIDALLEKLDFDNEKIIKFVTDDIYFEQYPGLLRGAQGTLMSRAGNALDQSVLLASLLRDAGFEARIARASLPEINAKALLNKMTTARTPVPPFANQKGISEVLKKMALLTGTSESDITSQLSRTFNQPQIDSLEVYKNAQADKDFILSKLTEAGITLGNANIKDDLVSEATDYYWVQYRVGSSQSWVDEHPVFTKVLPFL